MRNNFLVLLLFFAAVLSGAIYSQAPDIKLTLETEKREYQVGDKIFFTFRLEYPGEYKLLETPLIDSISAAGLEYLTTDTLQNIEKNGVISRDFNYSFSGFDSLDVKINKYDFRFVKGTDTLVKSTTPFVIKIRPLEIDTTKEISDVKPPERIPWGWLEYSILFGGLALAAFLGWLIYRRFKKKPVEEKIVEEPVKILTNFDKALAKLEEIDQKGYLNERKVKEHFSEVSDTLRWFFEVEFGFLSLEMTTRETIQSLNKKGMSQEIISGVDDFLTRADMVKFAKYTPSEIEQSNYIAGAVTLLKACDKKSSAGSINV
ncbi:MAG: hypothetical protein J0L60_00580 [Ignavibacteria bacterium]|nr:hypothetical protein [Ignavibacteria bacterium]